MMKSNDNDDDDYIDGDNEYDNNSDVVRVDITFIFRLQI